ncbi:general secretion pathway protein GspG [Snodgrassella sp. CFCC 13594]|uniref:general secretion pathway protein GspG n=1 Tax=Snodgrassella sp. CFCC 13594 TaxID=1775559 RepID=UPI000832CD23|nr:general secretion pathway protein GspG [Snodgrassella sp. CFCC 13594]
MQTLPYQPEVAMRMQANSHEAIDEGARFYHTTNGYWVAWHNGMAAVLADDTPPDVPCDWVEGAHDLAELVELIESGAYAEVEEFDGDDEAWHDALADAAAGGEHGCACGDGGCHHHEH